MRVSINGGASQRLFTARPFSMLACARIATGQCAIVEPSEDRAQVIVSAIDLEHGRAAELFRFSVVPHEDTWWVAISPDGGRFAATRSQAGPIRVLSAMGQVLQEIRVR